jgi:hypothetical protein
LELILTQRTSVGLRYALLMITKVIAPNHEPM